MIISGLAGAYNQQMVKNKTSDIGVKRNSASDSSSKHFSRNDSIELSKEGINKLAQVKNNIDSGYYNSDAVAEKITDKISDVLNDLV